MRHVSLLLIGLLLFVLDAVAQGQSAKPIGYIVTTSGDTVRGSIRIPQYPTERGVGFKADGQTQSKTYFASELSAFGVVGGATYETRKIALRRQSKLYTRPLVNQEEHLLAFAQVLVRGYATLYRLDHHFVPEQGTALEVSTQQTRFYLLSHPQLETGLLLGIDNLHADARTLFSNCEAAKALLPQAKLTDDNLAALVLAYNSCYTVPRAQDLRVVAQGHSYIAWSVRLGGIGAWLNYPAPVSSIYGSHRPDFSNAGLTLMPTLGAGMRFINDQSRISFVLGAQLTKYQSRGTNRYTVTSGFSNAGEQQTLSNKMTLTSVQLPVLIQYTMGQATNRWQPYLQFGPVFDFHLKNRTVYQAQESVLESNSFLPRLVARQRTEDYSANMAAAATLRLGLSQRVGQHRVLGEAYYLFSHELKDNGPWGPIYGSVAGLQLGYEW